MLLVASETGHVYTFATRKLQPMIISDAGKALIQTCLNSPDSDNLLMSTATSTVNASGAAVNGTSNSCLNQQQQQQQPSNLSPVSNASPASSSCGSTSSSSVAMLATSRHGTARSPTGRQVLPGESVISQASNNTSPLTAGTNNTLSSIGQSSSSNRNDDQPISTMSLAAAAKNNQQHVSSNQQVNAAALLNRPGGQNSTNNSAIQSQQNMVLAAAAVSTNSATSITSRQHQQQNSTTDQRMSATGFEETDLNYSISDELGDRVSRMFFLSTLYILVSSMLACH